MLHIYNRIGCFLRTALISMSIGAFLVSAGCGKARDKSPVLASIGETKITLKDFEKRISNLPERYRDSIMKRKKEYLEELINDTMLYQEAMRKGLNKDEDVQDVIKEAEKKILIARLLKEDVDDRIVITDADIKAYYDQHHNQYMTPEVLRASHILVLNLKDAEEIKKELDNGANFEDLARAKSVDPTAQRAGDIGYFPRGQLMPAFENACAALKVGQISGIVKTKLGYHIIKLTDRRPPVLRPIGEVKEDIKSRLRSIKRQVLFNELLVNLKKRTKVEINKEVLS